MDTPNTPRIDDAKTPTRASFSLANQRPLPADPFPAAVNIPDLIDEDKSSLSRENSQHSAKSRESEDVDMEESEGEEDGSDEESVAADGTRTMKKKKSQRFFCTDYPPCNLSFTRSEHLARHIRKHTGERPFQCHCSRRFSRLDNLRQHAQTVHVNEDIPNDSLAATGTRFQRQVRTDRVRPPGNRSRANTAGSTTSQGRGHHRNSLSTSSIGSVASTYSQPGDIRRRPAPLVMATDPRARYSLEDSAGQYQHYRPQTPTPSSATFDPNSPGRWSNALQSPISSHSRTASIYAEHRTPGRRLSVPAAGNPFQPQHGVPYGPPLTPLNSSNAGYSPAGSMISSPTVSASGSPWARRDSISSSNGGDEAWRRRTWHPDTYNNNFTSRLSNVSTPGQFAVQPPPNPQTSTRLPGIASFDPVPRPATPPRRQPSPMNVDTPSRGSQEYSRPDDRRNPHWELQRNLDRLDIRNTPPGDAASAWASEANRAVQAQAEQARGAPAVRFENYPPPREPTYQSHHASAPPITPREAKRHGWYHGPVFDPRNMRNSPEGSSGSEGGIPSTPGSAHVTDYHPSIVHSGGYIESSPSRAAQPQYQNYTTAEHHGPHPYGTVARMPESAPREEPKADGMMRLEALVAVATSKGRAEAC